MSKEKIIILEKNLTSISSIWNKKLLKGVEGVCIMYYWEAVKGKGHVKRKYLFFIICMPYPPPIPNLARDTIW